MVIFLESYLCFEVKPYAGQTGLTITTSMAKSKVQPTKFRTEIFSHAKTLLLLLSVKNTIFMSSLKSSHFKFIFVSLLPAHMSPHLFHTCSTLFHPFGASRFQNCLWENQPQLWHFEAILSPSGAY